MPILGGSMNLAYRYFLRDTHSVRASVCHAILAARCLNHAGCNACRYGYCLYSYSHDFQSLRMSEQAPNSLQCLAGAGIFLGL